MRLDPKAGREGPPDGLLFQLALAILVTLTGCAGDVGDQGRDGSEKDVGVRVSAITARPHPSCVYETHGGHDYWFCSGPMEWAAAEDVCASVQMHLARVDDVAENTFIQANVENKAWIGADDQGAEGQWIWAEGGDVFWSGGASGGAQGGVFARWAVGEPNNLFNEDCAQIRDDGRWNDSLCGVPFPFVCESSAVTASAPQAPDTACTRHVEDGVTYWVCDDERPWNEARQHCQQVGMDLVSIEDADESAFVQGLVRKNSYIGMNDRQYEGHWRWSSTNELAWCGDDDGRAPGPGYTNWGIGQPAGSANSCERTEAAGKVYYTCNKGRGFEDARRQCNGSLGMDLVRIDGPTENDLVGTLVGKDAWLGASDRGTEGDWRWLDDTPFWSGSASGAAVGTAYTNWRSGEPNDFFGEDCGVFQDGSEQWNDEPCECIDCDHAFVCEGSADTGAPEVHDCAWVHAYDPLYPAGKWFSGECSDTRGYVCESLPPNAGARLQDLTDSIRGDYQLGAARISDVRWTENSSVTRPFLTDEKEFGLRACVDTLEEASTPRRIGDVEQVQYAQMFEGVPVFGRGYSVRRDPTTKEVISATGSLAPEIEAETSPSVSESSAWAAAVGAVSAPLSAWLDPAPGRLVLMPETQGREPEYELSWLFLVPSTEHENGYDVAISATSGDVVMLRDRIDRACTGTSTLPSPMVESHISITDVPQSSPPDPDSALATYSDTPGDPILLRSQGTSLDPDAATFELPVVEAMCGFGPDYVTVPSSPVSVGTNPDENRGAAGLYVALHTCIDVLADSFQTTDGDPWLGFDGAGEDPVKIYAMDPAANEAFAYTDAASQRGILFPADERPWPGASIETMCHELGHGVWHAFLRDSFSPPEGGEPVQYGLETQAIAEGFGDVLGSFAEIVTRGPNDPGNYCMLGDEWFQSWNGPPEPLPCDRNLELPPASKGCDFERSTGVIEVGCPELYLEKSFCRSNVECGPDETSGPTCCDEHTNATVLGRWFYLLVNGGANVINHQCDYNVAPLSTDPVEAAHLAGDILFEALRDRFFSTWGGYDDLANATITVARRRFPSADAAEVKAVADAWYAVNVREHLYEDALADVSPARRAQRVDPWVVFTWPPETVSGAHVEEWDFQLAFDGNFQDPDLLRDVTVTRPSASDEPFTYAVGFPENMVGNVTWRVRPHTTYEWADCRSIHWFDDTGELPEIDRLEPDDAWGRFPGEDELRRVPNTGPDDQGRAMAGGANFSATAIPAAEEYRVYLQGPDVTGYQGCTDHPDVPMVTVTASEDTVHHGSVWFGIPDLLPETEYRIYIEAIGPDGLDGQSPSTDCFDFTFSTGEMKVPAVSSFYEKSWVEYLPPHTYEAPAFGDFELEWVTLKITEESSVRFYEMDADGTCATESAFSASAPTGTDCIGTTCRVHFAGVTALSQNPTEALNPEGYCWTVSAIAPNGVESLESEIRRVYFILRAPTLADVAVDGEGYAVEPVLLDWSDVEGANEYSVKIGRYPWSESLSSPVPSNCRNPSVLSCSTASPDGMTRADELSASQYDATDAIGEPGRYCWQAWPALGGGDGEPLVSGMGVPNCFSTPPADAVFDMPDEGEPGDYVTATVTFPYLPGGHLPVIDVEIEGPFGVTWDCDFGDESVAYGDRYDCRADVSWNLEGTNDNRLVASMHQVSDDDPDPSDANRVGQWSAVAEVKACGQLGLPCCSNTRCDAGYCEDDDNTCRPKTVDIAVAFDKDAVNCEFDGLDVYAEIPFTVTNDGMVDADAVFIDGENTDPATYDISSGVDVGQAVSRTAITPTVHIVRDQADFGTIRITAATQRKDSDPSNNSAELAMSVQPRFNYNGEVSGYDCKLESLPPPPPPSEQVVLTLEERGCSTLWDPVCHGLYNAGPEVDAQVTIEAQTCVGSWVAVEERACPGLGNCYFYGDVSLYPSGTSFSGMVRAEVVIDGDTVTVYDPWVGNQCN